MMSMAMSTADPVHMDEDDRYEEFLDSVRAHFEASVVGWTRLLVVAPFAPIGAAIPLTCEANEATTRLFSTDADGLYQVFLDTLPAGRQQHYTCNACRRFVDRFGGLVTISSNGDVRSALWAPSAAPPFFRKAVWAVKRAVERAKVTGVFMSDEPTWGTPQNKSASPPGVWHHMAVTPPPALIHKPSALLSTWQAMAERAQDYGTLQRGLAEFPIEVVRQAHTLLTTGQLYRSEKCIGVAKWLLDLHEARGATKNTTARDNLTWLAVASAPAGFCHVRSSMIGTLLEDIASGVAFDSIKLRFDAKMHPLQYQRPTAAPSAGNIKQAEEFVARLGIAGALVRRFARLDDVQALWTPKPAKTPETQSDGVFSHLKPKEASPPPQVEAPPVTMTWEKFARTVLPDAEAIEFYTPYTVASYVTMVTATNPDAPPILQWDSAEFRNPVSWYFYNGGSAAIQVGLPAGAWCPVSAVTLKPSMWRNPGAFAHQGQGVFFLLRGARDMRYERGAVFFKETLRSEYNSIGSVMEAYAKTAVIQCSEEASACGIGLSNGTTWNHLFRVTSKAGRVTYKLDRWD